MSMGEILAPRNPFPALLAALACLWSGLPANAASPWDLENKEVWRFPDCMKVVDIKQEFGAVGDGKADDTAAFQKAIDRRNAPLVYIPNGVYLVRDRIIYTQGPSILPAIQGESRDGVIIKLADDAKGFDDPEHPRAVLQLVKGEQKDRLSADYFQTKLRNLTIDTGKHKGATGLIFYANNNGMCRNVRIVGQGAIGLDLQRQLNGPLLISNVEIDGFEIGIKAGAGPFNSKTLEQIVLKNQSRYGIHSDGDCLSIRGVHSTNQVPAIHAAGGSTVLLDSVLSGGSAEHAAIVCGETLFARNIKTSGYGKAIEKREAKRKEPLGEVLQSVPGGTVAEWSTTPGKSLFAKDAVQSLHLPVEEAPYEPLDKDFSNWVCVDDFGAKGDGKTDDSLAIKQAISHAVKNKKTTICFRKAVYCAAGTIAIGGSIQRFQGANTFLKPHAGQELTLAIEEGTCPVVTFDLINRPLGPKDVLIVDNASSRTLVLRNLRAIVKATGPGKTFLEDSGNRVFITNPKARVWARQLNSEGQTLRVDVKNENQGGTLWVLGVKTEGTMTVAATTNGGKSEFLGGWIYVISKEAPTDPMFIVKEAHSSLAGVFQYHFQGKTYGVLVDETQGSLQRQWTKAANGGRWVIALFSTK